MWRRSSRRIHRKHVVVAEVASKTRKLSNCKQSVASRPCRASRVNYVLPRVLSRNTVTTTTLGETRDLWIVVGKFPDKQRNISVLGVIRVLGFLLHENTRNILQQILTTSRESYPRVLKLNVQAFEMFFLNFVCVY